METLQRLGAAHLRSVVEGYRDALRAHQEELNRLNVYPVPDGDTGTNMALTLESVVAELDGCDDLAGVCRALSHGSLMGARGNSGVILSQVLRGVAEVLRDLPEVDGADVARALTRASRAAYEAVMNPVEGTILTVVRRAAEAAEEVAGRGGSLAEVLDAAGLTARDELARTPELLPVLAEAGVVDAGAAGFVLLLDVLLHVVDGRPVPEPREVGAGAVPAGVASTSTSTPAPGSTGHGPGEFRYEVMYLLEAPEQAIPDLKQAWAAIGDSIAVVGGDGLWNCHVHTDDIGAAVEAGLEAGRPRNVRVTDLAEQVESVSERACATHGEAGAVAETAATATTGVVAVATGEGLGRILRSLGVGAVVAGGQSMNPSTAQILEAVEAVPAAAVVVLPNNRNIISVARQVEGLTAKRVGVVPTTAVGEAFAALLAYDPDGDLDANVKAMGEAAAGVATGEVTRAVRDSSGPAGDIREGDHLGISEGKVVAVRRSPSEAATALLEQLVGEGRELVTVVTGEGADEASTSAITDWLAGHRPDVEVEVHRGDQPLYPYLFAVE